MERGGGVVLHSNLRIHSSLPRWPLLLRRRDSSPSRGDPGRGFLRTITRRSPICSPVADNFRNCSKDKGYLIRNKVFQKPQYAVSVCSFCGPQEASLSSEEIRKDQLLIDCGSDQECVLGGIVALGKFDALHIGHRELAIQASKAGVPFLLSFVGMAEVLGWESRPPIVAKCDRKRVLSSWAPYCGNVIPLEYEVEFAKVRNLNPRQFVERLSKELRVSGVVAGENYRFGYRASGDASELVRLCKEYGLDAYIVSSVMDRTQWSYNGASKSIGPNDRGQVSSTRVRHALAMRDMDYVTELLGRKHRLVLAVKERVLCVQNRISVPKSCVLNQPPEDGRFDRCTLLLDDLTLGPCCTVIDASTVHIQVDEWSTCSRLLQDAIQIGQLIGIEFG